jgi:phage/plasmid-like protein (TIGR03299 family)
MPAEIFGDRFIAHRRPAWHGLGTVFKGPISATTAVMRAQLDYQVNAFPLTVRAYGRNMPVDRVAIVREPLVDDPQPRVFGVAGNEYTILQNTEFAALLDPLCEEWPVETAGALGYGERMFFTLDAGTTQVAGEELHQYFLITDGKTGNTSTRVAFTPVRVVCQNTLISGLAAATVTASIPHRSTARDELEFRISLMKQMRQTQQRILTLMAQFAKQQLTSAEVNVVLKDAYPEPKAPSNVALLEEIGDLVEFVDNSTMARLNQSQERYDYQCRRARALRQAAHTLFERFNVGHPHVAGTAWAIYNAVVETEDYREGGGEVEAAALFGDRAQAKARAFRAALDFCPSPE